MNTVKLNSQLYYLWMRNLELLHKYPSITLNTVLKPAYGSNTENTQSRVRMCHIVFYTRLLYLRLQSVNKNYKIFEKYLASHEL